MRLRRQDTDLAQKAGELKLRLYDREDDPPGVRGNTVIIPWKDA